MSGLDNMAGLGTALPERGAKKKVAKEEEDPEYDPEQEQELTVRVAVAAALASEGA
jgi:hypothetical protein